MIGSTIGFALGAIGALQLPQLPPSAYAWSGLLAMPALGWRRLRPLAGAALGFCYAWSVAGLGLEQRLPRALDGAEFIAVGVIDSLPESGDRRTRFNLRLDKLLHAGEVVAGPDRLRLSWYDAVPEVHAGERWRLPVKLRRPHGYANPGGFDYERWLFLNGIDGTGYVTNAEEARLLDKAPAHSLHRLRERLASALARKADSELASALLRALAVGDRRGLTDEMWHVLNATGTSHLVAISGLHVGLVAGLGFGLFRFIFRCIGRFVRRCPAQLFGAVGGLAAASGYAALAGFALPTRRALVMVAVVFAAVACRRSVRPGHALAAALLAVLVLDPLAPLGAGFWLSFGAVATLLAAFGGHVGRMPRWRGWLGAQWVVVLGLAPVTVAVFQRLSLVAPLVNLIAIPLVGLGAVPLALGGTVSLALPGPAADWLLRAAVGVLGLFWAGVDAVSGIPWAMVSLSQPGWPALVSAVAGAAWLLSPRGLPARTLGIVLLAAIVVPSATLLPRGAFRLDVLDVGQGLAVVVRTHSHVLVYDTGPRYRSGFHTARAVVEPYLRRLGVTRLDALMVSHGDSDHAGGFQWLASHIPAHRLVTSQPHPDTDAVSCRDGLQWRWDGVRFELLHPPRGMPYLGNASSCVLRVVGRGGSALLTGDINALVERRLASVHRDKLAAEILVVPHHGSDTSSSQALIDAVQPDWAVVSAGHGNAFGLPDPAVIQRYRDAGATVVNTARSGMLGFLVHPAWGVSEPVQWRRDEARLWTARP